MKQRGRAGVGVIVVCALWCGFAPRANGAALSLPFGNLDTVTTTNQLTNAAAMASPGYSVMTGNVTLTFRGAFTPASVNTRLAIQSDDGSDVKINGVPVQPLRKGEQTHWQDFNVGGALSILDYTFTNTDEYCIEIEYQNGAYTPGDTDGVTFYAWNGGGLHRDGIAVWGANFAPVGCSATLSSCGMITNWSVNPTGIVSLSGSGGSITVQGISNGTATVTAFDSDGRFGSRPVKVIKLGVSPKSFTNCQGIPITLVLTNSEVTNGVVWTAPGAQGTNSPDSRSNIVFYSTPGTNKIVNATWNGCTASATGVVVGVASLNVTPPRLCGSGQATFTATSTPPGYESWLGWSGDGVDGNGAQKIVNYTTPGVKSVTVSCGTSQQTIGVTVHHIDVTNVFEYGLAGSTAPVVFGLSSNSFGPYLWTVEPANGPTFVGGNQGSTASVLPGNNAGTFTVRAQALPLASCTDTATLQVVQATFSGGDIALCKGGSSNLAVTVNPPSAISLLSFDTVTNATFGPSNTHAHVTVLNGTNLTVHGVEAGTAYLRVRLGNNLLIGPTIQIVSVTFPAEPFYVGVGKTADYSVAIVPTNATVTFDTVSNAIATAAAIAGGVRLSGVAPGTTQVRAKVGGAAICSTQNVTAVRVQFPVDSLTLCNGNTTFGGVSVDPPGSPVTFSARDPSIVEVTAQGTNVTIKMLTNGKTFVEAKISGTVLAEMQVICGTITFPTNAWLAVKGIPQEFEFMLSPELSASELTFTVANPAILTLAAGAPSGLLVTGLTNGTTQINASIEPGQSCVSKTVTIFSAQLVTLEFTSDHNVLRDGQDVLTPGDRFHDVEWVPGGAFPFNEPITHTAGDSTKISTRLVLTLSGLPGAMVLGIFGYPYPSDPSEPALVLGSTNSLGSGTYLVTVQALNPLGKELRFINKSIIWSLNVEGNSLPFAISGPHRIWTTLGTPLLTAPSGASLPNIPRVKIAQERVTAAIASAGASPSAYTCYPRIVWHVVKEAGTYSLTNGTLNDVEAWELPDRPPRDCIAIARFARNVCMVMGVPGGYDAKTYMAYYRTPTNPNRPNEAQQGDLNNPVVIPGSQGPTLTTGLNANWILALADRKCVGAPSGILGDVGCSGGINAFEAAVVYTDPAAKNWYFPAGAQGSPRFDNPDGCVRLFQSMVWCSGMGTALVVEKVDHFYMRMDSLTDAQLCP